MESFKSINYFKICHGNYIFSKTYFFKNSNSSSFINNNKNKNKLEHMKTLFFAIFGM